MPEEGGGQVAGPMESCPRGGALGVESLLGLRNPQGKGSRLREVSYWSCVTQQVNGGRFQRPQVTEAPRSGAAYGQGLPGTHKPVSPQSLLAMSPEKRKLAAEEGRLAEPLPEEQAKDKPYTLEEFACEFFRCPGPPLNPQLPHTASPSPSPPMCSLRVWGGHRGRCGVHWACPCTEATLEIEGSHLCVSRVRWHPCGDLHWGPVSLPAVLHVGQRGGVRGGRGGPHSIPCP